MKKLFVYLNCLRAIPAIFAYFLYSDKECIRRDVFRNLGNDIPSKKNGTIFLLVFLLTYKKVFRNIYYYRIGRKNKYLAVLLNLFFHSQKDCEISGDIGPGLAIWHGYGTVISCRSIGENFSVWQGVTIGRNPKPDNIYDKPSFGNDCCVYSNAVVAGGITIGDSVRIGAGCVCMKSVPSDCTVLGNPCTIKLRRS